MRHKLWIGAAMTSCAILALAAKDPVLMKVGTIEVPQSEFEYLYHKNTQQQVSPQPLEEYVELFKIYKMKVADALANGIDTTASFRAEVEKYVDELAEPYLTDSVYLRQLTREAYDRMSTDNEVQHIMITKKRSRERNRETITRLDSIRAAVANGANFEELADQYTEDKQTKGRGGRMGFISGGNLPYDFETAMLSLKEGEISPVIESPMAYHIIKGGKQRPARPKIRVAHILKRVDPNADEATKAAVKAKVDSLYQIVKNDPSKFEEIARGFSDDPQSAERGGKLPSFGPGMMIEEFTEGAYALDDNEIGEPFQTKFGWHIVYRLGTEPVPTYMSLEDQLMRRVTSDNDDRSNLIRKHMVEEWTRELGATTDKQLWDRMMQDALATEMDSTFVAKWTTGPDAERPVASFLGGTLTAKKFAEGINKRRNMFNPFNPKIEQAMEQTLANEMFVALRDAKMNNLVIHYPEYRNLVKEYTDGSLLYEISLRKVWDKASQDTEGLAKFFDKHKKDFAWTEPRIKGFLVLAVNDTVANDVRRRMEELPESEIVQTIRNEFKRNVKIDRVLVKKGDNALVDYIMFNPGDGEPPLDNKYPSYFMFKPRTITTPETYEDVKGLVVTAYQDELEQQWLKQLKKDYPVKVDAKVLKTVK